MFGQSWDKAEATIVARDAKFTGDGSVATYTYVADVRLSSGETFRATVREPTIATDFWAPSIGDPVCVLVRSRDRKVKFDKDDDRLSVKAHEAGKKQAFEQTKQQPAGMPVPAAAPSTELPAAVAQKLAQLGIEAGTPMQVFTADSPQGQAALAAFTHAGVAPAQTPAEAPVQPPAEAPVQTPAETRAQTPESRLLALQSLHDRGLLTDAEYTEQRHRILDEL